MGAAAEGRRGDARDLGSSGAHADQRVWRSDVSGRGNRRRQRRRRGDRASAAGVLRRARALRRVANGPSRDSPIPASLQVGISFGSAPPDATPVPPPAGDDATLVLDEGMRWMVDFDAAVAVGMAVSGRSAAAHGFRPGRRGRRHAGRERGWRCADHGADRVSPVQRRRRVHPAGHADEQSRRFRERLLGHGGAARRDRSSRPRTDPLPRRSPPPGASTRWCSHRSTAPPAASSTRRA